MAGEEAFLDLAEASGIAGLAQHQLDPVRATTFGTGELILAARRAGARRIVVAAGGSATVDGGRGAFEAIERGGGLGDARLTVLCDVEVPFERAAEIFGPQKGATPEVVDQLSNRLAALAESWPLDPRGLPMGGAAGGFSGGCWAAYDARLVAGAGFVLDRLGFESRLRRANAVVAGEGRLDEQSFMGKILGAVASRSARADRPIHTVCGQVALREDQAMRFGLATSHEARTLAAIGDAGREIAEQLAAAM